MRMLTLAFLLIGSYSFAAAEPLSYTILGTGSGFVNAGGVNDPATNAPFTNESFELNFLSPGAAFDLNMSAASVDLGQAVLGAQSGSFVPGPPEPGLITSLSILFDAQTVTVYNEDPLNPGTEQEMLLSGSGLSGYLLTHALGPVNVAVSLISNESGMSSPGPFRIATSFGLLDFDSIGDATFAATLTPEPSSAAFALLGVLSGCAGIVRRSWTCSR